MMSNVGAWLKQLKIEQGESLEDERIESERGLICRIRMRKKKFCFVEVMFGLKEEAPRLGEDEEAEEADEAEEEEESQRGGTTQVILHDETDGWDAIMRATLAPGSIINVSGCARCTRTGTASILCDVLTLAVGDGVEEFMMRLTLILTPILTLILSLTLNLNIILTITLTLTLTLTERLWMCHHRWIWGCANSGRGQAIAVWERFLTLTLTLILTITPTQSP